MSLQEKIDKTRLPEHIAIIMDGNGRWAKARGNIRVFGHRSAIQAVRDTTEAAAELGIKYLTLFAFSTENWKRPRFEVNALMQLLVNTIHKETPTLTKNNIKLQAIGNLSDLPARCLKTLNATIEKTKGNNRMTLTLALSYGARSDMVQAIQKIASQVQDGKLSVDNINEELLSRTLSTHYMPDPELLIRTSGEYRISNFLLWEIAYSEIFITSKFWPDFRREDLFQALINFQNRERRFGKTGEQIRTS